MSDTVYISEMRDIVTAAVMNSVAAYVPPPDTTLGTSKIQVTMDGNQGTQIFHELKANTSVPIHHDSRSQFTQNGRDLRETFKHGDVLHRV